MGGSSLVILRIKYCFKDTLFTNVLYSTLNGTTKINPEISKKTLLPRSILTSHQPIYEKNSTGKSVGQSRFSSLENAVFK
jgi:hypothetical protein